MPRVEAFQELAAERQELDEFDPRRLLGPSVLERPTVSPCLRRLPVGEDGVPEVEEVLPLLLELLEEVPLERARLDCVVEDGDEASLHESRLLEGVAVAGRELRWVPLELAPEKFPECPDVETHLEEDGPGSSEKTLAVVRVGPVDQPGRGDDLERHPPAEGTRPQ